MTIESIARTYINMLSLYIEEEENTINIVVIGKEVLPLTLSDLQADWVIYAQDQAMTPLSESVRKREFIQSIPTLQALGVPPQTLLSELVRSLGLPESFVEEAKRQLEEQAKAVSAAKARTAGEAIQPDAVEAQQMTQPLGPNNLQSILPE